MSDAITSILTDVSVRDEAAVGQALFSDTVIYSSWYN